METIQGLALSAAQTWWNPCNRSPTGGYYVEGGEHDPLTLEEVALSRVGLSGRGLGAVTL